jgi:hypothetical protein
MSAEEFLWCIRYFDERYRYRPRVLYIGVKEYKRLIKDLGLPDGYWDGIEIIETDVEQVVWI